MTEPLNKLKLITLRKHNQYIIDNIAKFSYNKSKNIIVYNTCFGGFAIFNKPWDIYVLIFNTKKMTQIKQYVNKYYETLLPLFCVVNPDYLLITKAISTQIYEMAKLCNAAAIGGLYLKEMGGVLSDSANIELDRTYKGAKFPLIYKVYKDAFRHITPNNHGWLSLNTEYILRHVIKTNTAQKLVVVELGAWLGRSTVEMLKAAKGKSVQIYSFDKFQNITETDYKFDKPSPLDKFWLTVPRYETFCRNVSDHIDENREVYTVKFDVNQSIEMLRKNFITPDIVFLDAIKSKYLLETYLTAIFQYAPNIIFVGDDYVIDTVKEGVRAFHSKHKPLHLFTTSDCYIIAAKPIDRQKIEKYIQSELRNNYIENLVYALFSCKYKEVVSCLKKKPIDINIPIDFCNNNTFYTLVVIEIYSKKNKAAIELHQYILQHIDRNPKKIENSLFLTYADYIAEYNKGAPIVF